MRPSLLKIFFLSLLLLTGLGLSAQNGVVDLCPNIPVGPFTAGETISIDLEMSGVVDVAGIQIEIFFPSSILSYIAGTSIEPGASFSNPSPGELRIISLDLSPDLSGFTHPDGTAFYTLTFEVVTDASDIVISLPPDEGILQVASIEGSALPTSFCGTPIESGDLPDMTELCTQVNQDFVEAGFPVVGNVIFWGGFVNVTNFTYQLQFDETQMTYDSWTTIQEFGGGLTVDEPSPGLLVVTWAGDPLTLDSGVGFVIFNFTALVDIEAPNIELVTTPGSAQILYNGTTEGTIEFCEGTDFDPDSFVDFCPNNPDGPFTPDETVSVFLEVKNFVDMVSTGIPLSYDTTLFEFQGVWADLPTDLAATSWESLPNGGLRVFMTDFGGGGVTIPNGDPLLEIVFRAKTAAAAIDLRIDPAQGDFFVSRDLELTQQFPVTACDGYFLGSVLANVNAVLYADADNACSGVPSGDPLLNWTVTFTQTVSGAQFSALTNQYGNAYLALPQSDYTYEWTPPGNLSLWESCGPEALTVNDTTSINNLLTTTVNVNALCSEATVNLSSFNMRPCFDNNVFRIHYLNQGTAPAEAAYVDVAFDEAFQPDFFSIPFEDLGDNSYRFQLGDLAPNASGYINVIGLVDCEFPVGASVCAEATIYPYRTNCLPNDPSFEGGQLEVTADCDGDSIRFLVENIGEGPTGPVEFTIIEDVVIYMDNTIDLDFGESIPFTVPANGATYRFEAGLPNAAPYLTQGLAIREGCGTLPGGGISTGFVTAFPLLDGDPWFDRYCQETSAAYDPNDKQAIPGGVGPDNDILPNQTMDYKIRFQNTGNDTAFTVVIRDTIDTAVLDLASLDAGIASHPYHLNITNNVLAFTFENILLPDSTTNEPASHGFVHFSIAQQPGLPDGTLLENTAAIYFDFNDPIITNTSRQTIDRNLLDTKTINFQPGHASIPVYPSPVHNRLFLDLSDHDEPILISVYDQFGRELLRKSLTGATAQLNVVQLPSGHYVYRLSTAGQLVQTGIFTKVK